jgi:hypothetical protein
MIRILGMFVALLIVLAVIGYFRGWFHMESHDINGHETVTVTVDKAKLDQDKAHAEQEVRERVQK